MTEQFSQEPHRKRGSYDPNQPRVPAGQSTGGRWVDADGNDPTGAPNRKIIRDTSGEEAWSFYYNQYRPDGSLAEQVVFNRDRSRIISEFSQPDGGESWDERHTVITPDGSKLTFETSGDTQTIYDAEGRPLSATTWTEHGPEAQPIVQQAFLGAIAPAVAASIELGLVLLTWLSSRNGPDGTAIFAFRADEYRMPDDDSLPQTAMFVGRLSEEEVGRACPKLGIVQEETTKAAAAIDRSDYPTAAEYGTAVHTNLHDQIVDMNEPDLTSEVSLLKTVGETGAPPRPKDYDAHHGQKGSIRIDVLELTKTDTVCVYDIKTGKSRLYPGRTREIARAVQRRYPGAKTFIVTEVRP
jgi:hypothetical protein